MKNSRKFEPLEEPIQPLLHRLEQRHRMFDEATSPRMLLFVPPLIRIIVFAELQSSVKHRAFDAQGFAKGALALEAKVMRAPDFGFCLCPPSLRSSADFANASMSETSMTWPSSNSRLRSEGVCVLIF